MSGGKQLLRETMRGRLPEDKREADRLIARGVTEHAWFRDARSVLVYVSMPDEPDTETVIAEILKQGKILLVPKCIDRERMIAVRIADPGELKKGTWGIPEPANAQAWTNRIDLVIVPCVAASHDGKRLGHGAGYFDRFLRQTDAKKICLCYEERITDRIPQEEHDVLMDAVVTQNRIREGEEKT